MIPTTPRLSRDRQRAAPGALLALFLFLASFSPSTHPRLTSGERPAPELTWSTDSHAPVGDVERHRERPSCPAARPRRGVEAGPWRTPTVLAAILLASPALPSDAGRTPGTDEGIPVPATWRLLAPRSPRGPPPA